MNETRSRGWNGDTSLQDKHLKPGSGFCALGIQLTEAINLCTKYFEEKSRPHTPFKCLGETIVPG